MALELAIICDSFGLGGTAKAAATFALHHDRPRVRPQAIALTEPGVRAPELEAQGIGVSCVRGDEDQLVRILKGMDIVHVHRAGLPEPLVPAACRRAEVSTMVETNVFGWLDHSSDADEFAAHLFISQMCAMRHRAKSGLAYDAFTQRHRTLHYPVDGDRLRMTGVSRLQAHERLGLDPARPTVVRVGRDDDRKWGDILITMTRHLRRLVPTVQVVFVGVTPYRTAQLRRLGVLDDDIRCLTPTNDPHQLACFYGAADVFVSASSIGESFGLAIAEAMALGIPVVTNSTPWTDNAQVEVVDNGVNGWIANHPQAFAEATADLLVDRDRRQAFGAAAAAKAAALWDPAGLTRELERLFESLHATGALPPDWPAGLISQQQFETEYPERSAAQYRVPSTREQRQIRRAVLRERFGWVWRDLRANPKATVEMVTRLGVNRLRSSVAARIRPARLAPMRSGDGQS